MGKEVPNMSLGEESESVVISSGTDDMDPHLNGTKGPNVEGNGVEEPEGATPEKHAANGDYLIRASGEDGSMTPDGNGLQSKSPSRKAQVITFSFFWLFLQNPEMHTNEFIIITFNCLTHVYEHLSIFYV